MTEGSRALALAFVFFATLPATTSAALFCTCPGMLKLIYPKISSGGQYVVFDYSRRVGTRGLHYVFV